MDRQKRGIWRAMLMFIIVLLVVGLIAGALARLLVPGRDPIGFFGTILLGVVGSFVGGFLWNLVGYHRIPPPKFHTVGIIAPILAAVLRLHLMCPTGVGRGRPPDL